MCSNEKYQGLVRNVNFYLCYAYLELQDYNSAIRHGKIMINQYARQKQINKKTHVTVLFYLAECYCMIDEVEAASDCLSQAEDLNQELEKSGVSFKCEQQFNKQIIREKISPECIGYMNRAALDLCHGDLQSAKK